MARRLRIAYVYDALYPYVIGGAERRYQELASRLAPDHEVHRFSWTYWPRDGLRLSEGVHHHGVGRPVGFYGRDGRRRITEALAFALRLAPGLARRQFDVIDCAAAPYFPVLAAQACAGMAGAALVVTWHEYWGPYWRKYLPHLGPLGAVVERLCTLAGDVHVAVSPYTARKLRAARLGRGPVVVVPNGIDTESLDAVAPAAQPCDAVYLGRLVPEKRVDLLLRAVRLLLPRHPGLRVVVVGEGPSRPSLERLAGELGLGSSLTFAGVLDQAAALQTLKGSKMCVLPSEREGFGMVVLESQAMGVPAIVVRSPESAATDLVEHGRTGLISGAEPRPLATAMNSLLVSAGRRQALAETARRASRSYRWDMIASNMEALYQKAAERRKGHDHSVRTLSRNGRGEQAADPVPAGAATGRQASGPGLQ